MITFFSIPKPFRNHIGIIQDNAIRSWLQVPRPEIILFGDEEGVEGTAARYQIRYEPEVEKNEYGTPLLDSIFKRAAKLATNDILCYINSDIVLLTDMELIFKKIKLDNFLVIGQRWDLNMEETLNVASTTWREDFRCQAMSKGVLHPRVGSDYFAYKRNTIGDMPPFVVGRPGWDNWLIHHARASKIPVIDGSDAITVVHQNHDYSHVPQRQGMSYYGPEALKNLEYVNKGNTYILDDADWEFVSGMPQKKSMFRRLRRSIARRL